MKSRKRSSMDLGHRNPMKPNPIIGRVFCHLALTQRRYPLSRWMHIRGKHCVPMGAHVDQMGAHGHKMFASDAYTVV